jgi:hypothetical protein
MSFTLRLSCEVGIRGVKELHVSVNHLLDHLLGLQWKE